MGRNWRCIWTLIWWIITFRSYKVIVCKFWEGKGMLFHFAVRQASKTTKEQYKLLVAE